jgi:hypothetical protein
MVSGIICLVHMFQNAIKTASSPNTNYKYMSALANMYFGDDIGITSVRYGPSSSHNSDVELPLHIPPITTCTLDPYPAERTPSAATVNKFTIGHLSVPCPFSSKCFVQRSRRIRIAASRWP